MSGPLPHQPPPLPGQRLRTGAWILYDLANTVYAATLTFVFTPWAKERLGGLTGHAVVNFGSMVAAGLLVPLLGALVDHTMRTRRYLVIATLACVLAIAGWSIELGNAWLLGCFFVANLTYNVALLFYNSLLPAVAADDRVGRVSGLGVGLGYFGTILVLAVLLPLRVDAGTRFLLAAAAFLVLALPCLVLVRDRRPPRTGDLRLAVAGAARQLGTAMRELPQRPALLWFLLGNFCLVDVLNTAILYFAAFTTDVFRDSAVAGTLQLFGHTFSAADDLLGFKMATGVALNALALVFGIALGGWADRAPLAVMRASGLALAGALCGGVLFGGHDALGYMLTLVVFGAFGLAGIWTAGRKVIVVLAPKERIGEYFGLYGITVKLSVVGAVVYGVVADAHGSKPAMLAQGVQLSLGLLFLAMVRLPRQQAAVPAS